MDRRRVLLVDDEELLALALSSALRAGGYRVSAVGSAEEALASIEAAAFDLCFLDWRLPGMDGLRALESIKETSPGTKVVFMTADRLTGDERRRVDRWADGFLEKPFDLDQVGELTRRVLGRR